MEVIIANVQDIEKLTLNPRLFTLGDIATSKVHILIARISMASCIYASLHIQRMGQKLYSILFDSYHYFIPYIYNKRAKNLIL